MGDGDDQDSGVAAVALHSEHEAGGAILSSDVPTGPRRTLPKVFVAEDQAGSGFGNGHGLIVEEVVECGQFRIIKGLLERGDEFIRKFGHGDDPPVATL